MLQINHFNSLIDYKIMSNLVEISITQNINGQYPKSFTVEKRRIPL